VRKQSYILLLAVLFCSIFSWKKAFATHNRAGEITYEHLGGLKYRVTIVTYTKISAPADRDSLELNWGDGSPLESIPRTEKNDALYGNRDIRRNTYTATHTYTGAGNYKLSFNDPNRNNNILNLKPPQGQSDAVTFYIESILIINPFAPPSVGQNNSSAVLLNPPIDIACFGQTYIHNPGAFDPEGDSLVYSLVPSRITGGEIPDFYVFPDQISPGPNNNISIDPNSGDLVWDAPQRIGEYNVAILIQEYREGILVGEILRDMQIEVRGCNNRPPIIINQPKECIVAGDTLRSIINATDPDDDAVNITGVGELFFITPNTAQLNQNSTKPAEAELYWESLCNDIRLKPYTISIKAEDDHPQTPLVDFSSLETYVLGPAVQNFIITNEGNQIKLSWDVYNCTNATGFKIYRRNGASNYIPADCETGVPARTGYSLLATSSDANLIEFIDQTIEEGLEYCYIVTACFADGSESIASMENCSELGNDRPYFIKASVGETNTTTGIDTLIWRTPIDTIELKNRFSQFKYVLSQIDDSNTKIELLNTNNSFDFSELDTSYINPNQNTVIAARNYVLDFFVDDILYTSSLANSLHIIATPTDNQIRLSWESNNAWSDTLIRIYRKPSTSTVFSLLDEIEGREFTDNAVENGNTYCYYIVEHSKYINPLADQDISNYSQQICSTPIDNVAPCPPTVDVQVDCTERKLQFNLTKSATDCDDDVESFNLYFSNLETGPFIKVDSTDGSNTTFLYQNDTLGITGCFYFTSTDTTGNESNISEILCNDECDDYILPNVFTPNGDGANDFFRPFPFSGILSADVKILNRWGKLVFETDDPNILWDGKYQDSGKDAGEGVFFYVITITKYGIEQPVKQDIQGDFTLIRD
tara:strand:+ start:22831 stop:25458 length:2628 start_codon:yes stop_codon:yes gene_type:complete